MTQQVRSDIRRDRLLAGRRQGVLEDRVDDLAVLESVVRCPVRDEHRAAVRRSTFLAKIPAQCFADFDCNRQAVMQFALTAHHQLARAPVDIVELDRDDLGCSQSEARREQQHRVIPRAMPGVAAHRGEDGFHPIG